MTNKNDKPKNYGGASVEAVKAPAQVSLAQSNTVKDKPAVYEGTPVGNALPPLANGYLVSTFLIDGDTKPKVGDTIRIAWDKQSISGIVLGFVNDNTVRMDCNSANNKE